MMHVFIYNKQSSLKCEAGPGKVTLLSQGISIFFLTVLFC